MKGCSYFLQGRMDIDEKSLWFDKDFNHQTGGFLINDDFVERKITELDSHDNVRRDMLILLSRSIIERKVEGAIAEVGVYQGMTAKLFHHYFPDRKLYLFDTFSGFDHGDIEKEKSASGLIADEKEFANTSVDKVLKYIAPTNDNIVVVEGLFPGSLTNEAKEERYALVHLDADLYQPTIEGLRFFYDKMSEGGYIIVHDYNAWKGARLAVDEFCVERSVIPIPMPDKSGSCLIVK